MSTQEYPGMDATETPDLNYDFEVASDHAKYVQHSTLDKPLAQSLKYGIAGIFFGIILVKSQVISWFRIQEMFRLQRFHMYGVIGSAVVVGIISLWLIRKLKLKTIDGEPIRIEPKKFSKGQIYGGLLFGLGWGITGACPGPLFAQIGTGVTAVMIPLLSAIFGTWVYGMLKNRLPH